MPLVRADFSNRIGTVAFDNNGIVKSVITSASSVPDAGSTFLLLSSGLGILFSFKRQVSFLS